MFLLVTFRDSKIAKNISLRQTKLKCVASFGIAPCYKCLVLNYENMSLSYIFDKDLFISD